jgi:hypothetical protein
MSDGFYTTVHLTCQECGVETDEDREGDENFNGERAVEAAGWGYSDNAELLCAECEANAQEREEEAARSEGVPNEHER